MDRARQSTLTECGGQTDGSTAADLDDSGPDPGTFCRKCKFSIEAVSNIVSFESKGARRNCEKGAKKSLKRAFLKRTLSLFLSKYDANHSIGSGGLPKWWKPALLTDLCRCQCNVLI